MVGEGTAQAVRSSLSFRANIAACGLVLCVLGACTRGETSAARTQDGTAPQARLAAIRAPATLRLATWNLEWLSAADGAGVRKRNAADYARLRRYAENLNADVIAIQEVEDESAARRVFPPDRYKVYVARHGRQQRTGFVYKKELTVAHNSDFVQLDVGGLRAGADITLTVGGVPLRLLSVHLKSGCFDEPLPGAGKHCKKLHQQVSVLESWIDARANEGVLFGVLGDFNRRFFARPEEPFWKEIDDSQPPEADLWSPTSEFTARCWSGEYPDFIDHLVLSRSATRLVQPQSFVEHLYEPADKPHKGVLSAHCPLSITLSVPASDVIAQPSIARRDVPSGESTRSVAEAPSAYAPSSPTAPIGEAPSAPASEALIKGNISRGRKLYHLPSCPSYKETKIELEKGERLFRSEAEAHTAGWRKADNCN